MLFTFELKTRQEGLHNITSEVRQAVSDSGVSEGVAVVYCPHTTGGITVNENADPDVVRDIRTALERFFPDLPDYSHAEGNSRAHLLSSIVGPS